MKISLIGAGVMGEALIAALIKAGNKPSQIEIIEKRKERCDELIARYSISEGNNLNDVDVLLLVTKPQDIDSVLSEINGKVKPGALVVSFAAGKKIATISKGLNGANPVIRVMPNTPTLVGKGAAGYSLGEGINENQKKFLVEFLSAAGIAVEVSEELQDAVTATSGSGPAYFFAFVESMVKGAEALGLSKEVATELTVQTIIGASELLATSGKSATTLRENVTSPNGTTYAALQSFASNNLENIVADAMKAARDRSIELS
jgi:pyrroline-5-carboxylate reductase